MTEDDIEGTYIEESIKMGLAVLINDLMQDEKVVEILKKRYKLDDIPAAIYAGMTFIAAGRNYLIEIQSLLKNLQAQPGAPLTDSSCAVVSQLKHNTEMAGLIYFALQQSSNRFTEA